MLNFDKHINTICKCSGKQLSVLQRLSKDVGHDEKHLYQNHLSCQTRHTAQ